MPRSTYRVPFDAPARFVVSPVGGVTDTRPAHRQRFALVTGLRDGVQIFVVRDFGDGREIPFKSRARAVQGIERMRRNGRGFLGWPIGASVHYVETSSETIPGPNELDGRFELTTDGNGLGVLRDHAKGFEIPLSSYERAAELLPAFRSGSLDLRIFKTRPIGLA